jgi:hypothetical protein
MSGAYKFQNPIDIDAIIKGSEKSKKVRRNEHTKK